MGSYERDIVQESALDVQPTVRPIKRRETGVATTPNGFGALSFRRGSQQAHRITCIPFLRQVKRGQPLSLVLEGRIHR